MSGTSLAGGRLSFLMLFVKIFFLLYRMIPVLARKESGKCPEKALPFL
jgi:hypothetical protein